MKAYLFKHDIPIKQCAGDLGISTSYLYQLLKNERKPSLALAIKIEKYTDGEVTAAELMGVEEESIDYDLLKEESKLDDIIDRKLEPIRKRLDFLDKRIKMIEGR